MGSLPEKVHIPTYRDKTYLSESNLNRIMQVCVSTFKNYKLHSLKEIFNGSPNYNI